jgi:hypothetical protein
MIWSLVGLSIVFFQGGKHAPPCAGWVIGSGRRGYDLVVEQGLGKQAWCGVRFGRRAWPTAGLLKLDFLGHGGDGIPDPAHDNLQCIGRNLEPPGQGTNVSRIRKIDFIAKRRMFDTLHGDIPWLRDQRQPQTFVPFHRQTLRWHRGPRQANHFALALAWRLFQASVADPNVRSGRKSKNLCD